MTQEEQRAVWREQYRKYHPIQPSRNIYSSKHGRIVTKDHYAIRIFWSEDMLDFLKANYATTLNEELAGCLGVSVRTLVRKAREIGVEKDQSWLRRIWDERRLIAHVVSKKMGYPGTFKKGQHASPATEFKQKKVNEEMSKKARLAKAQMRKCKHVYNQINFNKTQEVLYELFSKIVNRPKHPLESIIVGFDQTLPKNKILYTGREIKGKKLFLVSTSLKGLWEEMERKEGFTALRLGFI